MRLPVLLALLALCAPAHADLADPIAKPDLVFQERDGFVAVEAEHFVRQEKTDVRAWYLTSIERQAGIEPDADGAHLTDAGGGAYLEILPDTRKNHGEKLIKGENFINEPGKMAILSYRVNFETAGKYYVWARIHSTGTEDNGMHVGIDGGWPASGQRMQWTAKRQWAWGSKQRTEKVHTGVPGLLFLNVRKPGEHLIQFSMREDGFEFDQWLMTTDPEFKAPDGPAELSAAVGGKRPEPFRVLPPGHKIYEVKVGDSAFSIGRAHGVSAQKIIELNKPKAPVLKVGQKLIVPDPQAQGQPQADLRPEVRPAAAVPVAGRNRPTAMRLSDFPTRERVYLDRDKWLAVNPGVHKEGRAAGPFPFNDGVFDLTLHAVGENDGRSKYSVIVGGKRIGEFECPLGAADATTSEGPEFTATFRGVRIDSGAMIEVRSAVDSEDGVEFSRARWSHIAVRSAGGKPALRNRGIQRPATAPGPNPKVSFKGDLFGERMPDGNRSVEISGELKQWHKVTLTLDGPYAHEKDNKPNPFTDYHMAAVFRHESGSPHYAVPGYFAADGNAGETSAESGTKWRAHLSPDKPGKWIYQIAISRGPGAALNQKGIGMFVSHGNFNVSPSDKTGRDLRGRGRLQYVGRHHLQFAGSKEYFLKAGADAPETFLGYADFDGTVAGNPGKVPLKTWAPHVRDWKAGDPTWKDGKGKGMIGAINYLSAKGCNVFSFLTYNAGGDGDNVWPFIERNDPLNYDCSKLDQWSIVFDHATARGMYLHFKLQETENDDKVRGGHKDRKEGDVPTALDGGELGTERMLYCREIVARFGHNLALNWNLGEENTQTTKQQRDMASYLHRIDPYGHLIVVHTYPNQQDKVYRPLLGEGSVLRGASLQNSNVRDCHSQVVKWTRESARAKHPWVIGFDEPGTASEGMPADPGYPGMPKNFNNPSIHDTRKYALWGTLLAGGSGVEYYFGYKLPQNDLVCEDWRSRDQSWDYCRIALEFFQDHKIPFWEMTNSDGLVGNPKHDNAAYCYAKSGEVYLVYLPAGGSRELDLSAAGGVFTVRWLNPREGGDLIAAGEVKGGGRQILRAPDAKGDWLAVVGKE